MENRTVAALALSLVACHGGTAGGPLPSDGGADAGTCAESCPAGCCSGTHCEMGTTDTLCGDGGVTCSDCTATASSTAAQHQVCRAQACTYRWTVTLRYDYTEKKPSQPCNTVRCFIQQGDVTESRLRHLEDLYGYCKITEQPGFLLATIDCSGNCPAACPLCSTPAYTSSSSCLWVAPPE